MEKGWPYRNKAWLRVPSPRPSWAQGEDSEILLTAHSGVDESPGGPVSLTRPRAQSPSQALHR